MSKYRNKWQSVDDHPGTVKSGSSPVIAGSRARAASTDRDKFINNIQGNLRSSTIRGMSQHRQSEIHEAAEIEEAPLGLTPESFSGDSELKKMASAKAEDIKKYGSLGGSGSINPSSSTIHLAPDLYSPLFLTQNLQLPRDRITANAWNRAFYETNPYVRNAINMHATFPVSKFNIKCADKKVEKFFNSMIDELDLLTVVQQVALEWWKLGEAFPYASLNEQTGRWDNVYLHNPDYVSVKRGAVPGRTNISLRPDPELEKIVNSSDPAYMRKRNQLDSRIVQHILKGEYIPLDNMNISHLKYLSSPYDVRGTSIIVSIWKDLMMYDKLRESKFVQADSMINPVTLIKIGSSTPDGHYPTQDDLEQWRNVFESIQYDKDAKIVCHPDVNVERVGFSGHTLDTQADFQMITDNILMGLMMPKSVVTQEGATYASASVALDVMRQRYLDFRSMMTNWLRNKIFAPISELQKFYEHKEGDKKLIVPEVEWNQMTLYDMDSYIGHLMTLQNDNKVSKATLFRSLGLDPAGEAERIREENLADAITAKEQAVVENKTLHEIRNVDPSKPIVESVSEEEIVADIGPLPGTDPTDSGDGGDGGDVMDMGAPNIPIPDEPAEF